MSSIYLAARYTRHPEMQEAARILKSLGHEITSRWIWGSHQVTDDGLSAEGTAEQREQFAREDLEDLEQAEMLIAFTEPPRTKYTRGGRHVELGYALGKGKRVHIVGPAENVFCCLPEVTRFDTLRELASYLSGAPVCDDRQKYSLGGLDFSGAPDDPVAARAEFKPSVPKTPCESCEAWIVIQRSEGLHFKCTKSGAVVPHIPELLQSCPLHQQQEAVNVAEA